MRDPIVPIVMTPENLTKAIELALAASDAQAWGGMKPEHVAGLTARTSSSNEQFVVWFADQNGEEWFTAITGNGEKSAANAEFYASARKVVLGLVDLVDELRTERRALLARAESAEAKVATMRKALVKVLEACVVEPEMADEIRTALALDSAQGKDGGS